MSELIINQEVSISEISNKMEMFKVRTLVVVDAENILLGTISGGDIRRSRDGFSSSEIKQLINRECKSVTVNEASQFSWENLNQAIDVVPIVNNKKEVVNLLKRPVTNFLTQSIEIGINQPVFIIAEIGNNHQGSIENAFKLINHAAKSGANCVKFQHRCLSELYQNIDGSNELGSEYTSDLLKKFQLTIDELNSCFNEVRRLGLVPMCTPWDYDSWLELSQLNLPLVKIASADFTNKSLIRQVATSGAPLILSTGMTEQSELDEMINWLLTIENSYALLHCNSTYPTPYKDIHLGVMNKLMRNVPIVGYSGHERGFHVPIAAVANGAKIIEKHLTTDKNLEGADHKVSLLPHEFEEMVRCIRDVEQALIPMNRRHLSQGEKLNRINLSKGAYSTREILEGEKLSPDMIVMRTPALGLKHAEIEKYIGKTIKKTCTSGEPISYSNFSDDKFELPKLQHTVGIPVRYHDLIPLAANKDLRFIEFHLSYADLDKNIPDLSQFIGTDISVHCPELFQGDHILNLATDDENYRNSSIDYLKNTIETANRIGDKINCKKPIPFIMNVGGFSISQFKDDLDKPELYNRVYDAIKNTDFGNCIPSIQTMPPFPWHFGGQRYHNIFVKPDEIKQFCQDTELNVCLDTSHTKMACNYYNYDFSSSITSLMPFVNHIHIADASGVDGEGVEFGAGDIDFENFKKCISEVGDNVSLVVETWQGHLNGGQGFWDTLIKLDSLGY